MTSEPFPSMRDVPQHEREQLFLRKLKACEVTYDFSDVHANYAHKEAKRRNLIDIADYVSINKGVFTERTLKPFMDMVCANIMRDLPVGTSTDRHYDAEEDEPHLEPAWTHLQVVYELLRKFVVSSDAESQRARAHITARFVEGIVELFNSEDPREREYLKTILHRIYGKVMPLRAPIRRAIMNAFYRVVHERQRHNGISELLEILGSIINGFSVPLKEEHKALLRRGLVPLHTTHSMPSFHTQLSFCVTQFVQKDPGMASEVLKELVRHWPVTHTRKEVMFLNELEELMDLARPQDAEGVVCILFKQLARCMESPHFQVAERVLYFWNNEYVVNLFMHYRKKLMPIVVGALHENVESHWNPNVQSLSFHVQKLLRDMDADLYIESIRRYHLVDKRVKLENSERLRRWRALDSLAERRRQGDAAQPPAQPCTDRKESSDGGEPAQADRADRAGCAGRGARTAEAGPEATGGDRCAKDHTAGDRSGGDQCGAERAAGAVFVRCGDASPGGDGGGDDTMRAGRGTNGTAGKEAAVAAVGVDLSV